MGAVILAATALAGSNGAFSPQHVNNWAVEIHGSGSPLLGNSPMNFALRRGFLPNFGVDDVEIPLGNESVHVAGRAHFEGGTLEVNDYVDKDIAGAAVDWFALVYGGPRGKWGVVGVPSRYKREADLILSAPDGSSERSWHLQGLWPVTMNPGALDMGSSEIVQIAMGMRYDRAQYMGGGTSISGI